MHYKECFECRRLIQKDLKGLYCNECRTRAAKVREKSYSVKGYTKSIYNNPAYKAVRVEALKRAGYMCEVCQMKGMIEPASDAHHIIKVVDGDNSTHYDVENLVAVCGKCHRMIEGLEIQELIKLLQGIDVSSDIERK